jgi:hypothetical protein
MRLTLIHPTLAMAYLAPRLRLTRLYDPSLSLYHSLTRTFASSISICSLKLRILIRVGKHHKKAAPMSLLPRINFY